MRLILGPYAAGAAALCLLCVAAVLGCGGGDEDQPNYFDPNAARSAPAPAATPAAPPPAAPAATRTGPAAAPAPAVSAPDESSAPTSPRRGRRLLIPRKEVAVPDVPDTPEDSRGQATAVRAIGPATSNPDLMVLVRTHENKYVRGYATELLTERNVTRALDVLYEAMRDAEAYVRRRAALGVARLDPCSLSPALLAALEAGRAETRFVAIGAATETLQLCGDAELPALQPLEAVLARLVHDPSPEVRSEAIILYGRLKYPDAAEVRQTLFVRALGDTHADVRLAALRVLGGDGLDAAVPQIIPLLDDSDTRVQKAALAVLASTHVPEALNAVRERLSHSDPDFRVRAIQALGALRDPASLEDVIELLTDDMSRVRYEAVKAVAKISPDEAPFILVQMFEDSDAGVRLVAAYNLAQLCPKDDAEVACALAAAAADRDEDVALQVVDALRCMRPRTCTDEMIEALCKTRYPTVREALSQLLEGITHHHPAATCAGWRAWQL